MAMEFDEFRRFVAATGSRHSTERRSCLHGVENLLPSKRIECGIGDHPARGAGEEWDIESFVVMADDNVGHVYHVGEKFDRYVFPNPHFLGELHGDAMGSH